MIATRSFTEQDPIRVFLLDDHEVVRRGITDLLDAEPDISVVGDADTVEHALVRGPALRPDVAVLDVRLPDGDGITVCRELRNQMPELACLMLTSFDDEDALLDAIMAGPRATYSSRSGDPTWSRRYGRSPRASRCSTPRPRPA
jgi:two-component system response regulator DevR